jgi:hypothetical protein
MEWGVARGNGRGQLRPGKDVHRIEGTEELTKYLET